MRSRVKTAALWAAYGVVLVVGVPAEWIARWATVAALVIDAYLSRDE